MGFQRSSDKLATSFAPVPCSTSDLRPNSPSFASIYCECVNCESHAHKSNTEYVRSSALRLSLDPLLQHCRVLSETPLSGPRWPTSLNIKKKKEITDHANPEGNGPQRSKERGRRGSTGPPQPEQRRQKHHHDYALLPPHGRHDWRGLLQEQRTRMTMPRR